VSDPWTWPLPDYVVDVPGSGHPGSFGAVRRHDIHTGVDLYAPVGAEVVAVEDGVIVSIEAFTGPAAGSPWWNDTTYVMVEGASGVVLYGEIATVSRVGDLVSAGDHVGNVQRVLTKPARRDIPGHLSSMLHVELYIPFWRKPLWWRTGESQPNGLLDPTPFLRSSR